MRKIVITLSVVVTLILSACSASKSTTGETSTVTIKPKMLTYSSDVKAIIDLNCSSTCHGVGRPAGGIDLTTYDKVKDQALNGKLIPAIQQASGVEPMPKKAPKLEDATIQIIVDWAAAGAPN